MVDIYRPIVESTVISFEYEPPDEIEFERRFAELAATNPFLVMERDGQIAGYAYSSTFRARAAYASTRETTVYVSDRHRRNGVATALMRALVEEIRSDGAHRAVAAITLPNDPSVALHESLGFSHIGTFNEAGFKFGRWHDVGFWELRLE